MKRLTVPALVAVAALAGCNSQSSGDADANAIAAQIRADEVQWVRDWASRDVDRIVAHYAPDASLISPGSARATGAAPIRAAATAMLRDPNLELRFTPDRVEVAASGDLAYSRGTFSLRLTDPATGQPASQSGTYLTTYRKQSDGSWKAVDDIAAPGAPAPPPAH